MSLTFNNRDVEVWKALIDALINAGFRIENATYQVPAVVPAKAQLSKSGCGVGDIIVNVRKITSRKQNDEERKDRVIAQSIVISCNVEDMSST